MAIDIEALRNELLVYYGTAMFNGMPMAIIDMTAVEKASDEEIIRLAKECRMDLGKFERWET